MLEARVYNFGSVGITTDFSGYEDFSGNTLDSTSLNTQPCNYLTFDGNGVDLLDNNLKFYEEGDYSGYTFTYYVGNAILSNERCNLGSDCPLWIEPPYPEKITIQFFGNCCSRIMIEYCSAATGETLDSQLIDVNGEFVTFALKPWEYGRIVITFTKTIVPNQCIRICSIFDGTVDRLTNFTQHSLLEEINILSDDLPINQFEFSIAEDVSGISKNTPLKLYNNNKYYGEYYVRTNERTGKNIYSIVAQNVLCLYDNVPFYDWEYYGDAAATELIILYLGGRTNSNIYIQGTTTGSIGGPHTDGSCRVALCELAYDLAKMVYSSRSYNNDVYLIDVPTKVTSVITNADRRIIGEATYKKTSEFANAEKRWQILGTPSSDYQTKTVTGNIDDFIVVTFDKPTFIKEASGVIGFRNTLMSYVMRLTATTAVITYAEYPTTDRMTTIANLNTVDGETKKYDSFLTYPSGDNGSALMAAQNKNIQKYISSKGTVTAKIRLRNEKVGDLIQIETALDGIITGIITKMTISFGYEDIADIEVVEWSI